MRMVGHRLGIRFGAGCGEAVLREEVGEGANGRMLRPGG